MNQQPLHIENIDAKSSTTMDRARKFFLNKWGGAVVSLTTVGALAACSPSAETTAAPDATAISDIQPAVTDNEGTEDSQTTENQGDTQTETEQPPANSVEIPASTEPEMLGEVLATKLSTLVMGAATPELKQQMLEGLTNGEIDLQNQKVFFEPIVLEKAYELADSLFVPGWRENPELKKWVDHQAREKAVPAVELYTKTFESGQSDDKVPYEYKIEQEGPTIVISETETTVSISSDFIEQTNMELNRAEELHPNLIDIEGNPFTIDATFERHGDALLISVLDIKPRQ